MSTVFHRTEPPWFDAIRDLKPGQSRRVTDAQKVSFNGRAYHLWDFREKTSEVYEPQLSLAERLANAQALREAESAAVLSHKLPQPQMLHPQDWPGSARVWMHKADINNEEIMHMGAYWHPSMRRAVLPLVSLDGTESWIARDVGLLLEPGTKYLFPANSKRGGGAVMSVPCPDSAWRATRPVVITEDMLSAFRVSRDACVTAVAAQGTSLDRDAIVSIARRFSSAVVWLDPDKYGQLGARRIMQQLDQVGVAYRNIKSDRDPKNLDRDTLKETLQLMR